MKKFVSAVLAVIILSACGKKDVLAPEKKEDIVSNTTKNLYYQDGNVAITDVKATPSGQHVNFQFTSLYERNVAKMEVMSGPYENMLCFFYAETLPAVSNNAKTYTVTENNAASGIRYYVIKYTMKSGAWVLTPAFRYQK